jgi:DNA polymerase
MVPSGPASALSGVATAVDETLPDECAAAWQSILVASSSSAGAPAGVVAVTQAGVTQAGAGLAGAGLAGAGLAGAVVSAATGTGSEGGGSRMQQAADTVARGATGAESAAAAVVKRPAAAGPSFVQSTGSVSGVGTPAFRGASAAAGEDGPPLSQFPDLGDADRGLALQQLAAEVSQCTRCPELVGNRTQTVFGFGAARTRLVLMGEAPGAEEDRLGVPMVGASGQLLDKIIAAMTLRREDVYILNTVKCRPPKNRNPADVECSNCRPFWVRQLEIIRPEVIVCLGAVASKTLLQTSLPVGRLRGQVHDYRGAKVIVTYHPSYLLRTEDKKRETWDDMKVVMSLLGITRT